VYKCSVIIAVILLLLALLGVIPVAVAVPVGLVSASIGLLAGYMLQRRMSRVPHMNGPEAMRGRVAYAVSEIGHRSGTIKFGNELWTATTRATVLRAGTKVRILSVTGLKARVEAYDSDGDS